jgi:hypothetical protein
MGKRQRRRSRSAAAPAAVATYDYADAEGNVLTLREAVSGGTAAELRAPGGKAAASQEDLFQRRTELLFERFAVRWTIAGLPLTGQRELLGRYRMADQDTRRWVRETLDAHVRRHQPELA